MTGTGVISPGGAIESGCSAVAFDASVPVGIGTAIAADPRRRAHRGRRSAGRRRSRGSHVALLLFVDSESGDQAEIVDGAYEIAGGRIPLAGAAGETRAQFAADGRPLSGGVVAVAIAGHEPIGAGISHGCVLAARRRSSLVPTATSCSNSTAGRPKLSTSRRLAGDVALSDDDFEEIAMAHPLAQPELRGDVRPRYVRGRMPGAVSSAQRASRRMRQSMCASRCQEAIVRSAVDAVDEALGHLPALPRPSWSSTVLRGARGSAIRSPRARSTRLSRHSAILRPQWQAYLHVERSAGSGCEETATIASSSLHSAHRVDGRDELLRRFVEAARRAQIVTIVNTAASETELGEVFGSVRLSRSRDRVRPDGTPRRRRSHTRWRLRSYGRPVCRPARIRKLCASP